MSEKNQKTILVVYTDVELSAKEIAKSKKYSFNTSSKVKEGDVIVSPNYSTPMLVVKVLGERFNYYNGQTGEMSNTFTSIFQWEIRTLDIREPENPGDIVAYKVG